MIILINSVKMDNFSIILIFFVAVCYGANPDVLFKSQNIPLGIVNGTDAEDGEFPYVVQLYINNNFVCGGAIIDKTWILTASHCVEIDINRIVYGTNVLDQITPGGTSVKVKNSFLHPKFYYNNTDNYNIPLYDVGLLELEEPIQFSDKAQPLKLAESNDIPFHVPGILAGWGLNETAGEVVQTLQKVQLQLLNDSECSLEFERSAGFHGFDGVHYLCSENHYRGQCNGDSGGPFVIDGLIYGVVSWSIKPCATSPGTYSRITNPEYRDFIRNVTGI